MRFLWCSTATCSAARSLAIRRCSPSSTSWVVKARTSAASSRAVMSRPVTDSRLLCDVVRTIDSNASLALRTLAHPCGTAASSTAGTSTGWKTPTAATAATMDTTPASRLISSRVA